MLHRAGLAGVRWEQADLRDVDFAGVLLPHRLQSRSGLVGSTIASEGTAHRVLHRRLRRPLIQAAGRDPQGRPLGADLRGAKVKDIDFYLVDLRRARYSPDQADHFRRCGAIL